MLEYEIMDISLMAAGSFNSVRVRYNITFPRQYILIIYMTRTLTSKEKTNLLTAYEKYIKGLNWP